MTWIAIIALALGATACKIMGVAAGDRLPETGIVRRAVQLLPPALFCALIALQTFERDGELVVDARVVGVLVALVATWRRVPFIGVILSAMVATALWRAVLGG